MSINEKEYRDLKRELTVSEFSTCIISGFSLILFWWVVDYDMQTAFWVLWFPGWTVYYVLEYFLGLHGEYNKSVFFNDNLVEFDKKLKEENSACKNKK